MEKISRDTLKHQINLSFPEEIRSGTAFVRHERRFVDAPAQWFSRFAERMRMRRELPSLTDEELMDFHLTRKQAERLANKPFWRE